MWDSFISLMINTLLYTYTFVGQNFGVAIILFTILIRLVLYPLNAQQVKSTQAMQEMQKSKKWQGIQKKYKNDKEKRTGSGVLVGLDINASTYINNETV